MRITQPKFKIVDANHVLRNIELGARLCYKSEDKIAPGSDVAMAEKLLTAKNGVKHESVLEHGVITIQFVMDRGVSHEQVRHRHTSPSQESTRYCNYSKDKFDQQITVIDPFFFDPDGARQDVVAPVFRAEPNCPPQLDASATISSLNAFDVWFMACTVAEWAYNTLVGQFGASAQEARSVLPNSLKTEILITANVREWRHILSLRAHRDAHPQMRQIMVPLGRALAERWPCLFGEFADGPDHPSPAIQLFD